MARNPGAPGGGGMQREGQARGQWVWMRLPLGYNTVHSCKIHHWRHHPLPGEGLQTFLDSWVRESGLLEASV